MVSTGNERDAVVLESLVPNLHAEGFQVFLYPSRTILPPFLHGCRPDAIALKAGCKVAIEVASGKPRTAAKVRRLRDLLTDHPDWELRIIYAPPQAGLEPLAAPPQEVVQQALGKLLDLLEQAGPVPALLTAWAAFEAAGRALNPDSLGRPQTAGRLVETLAFEGCITPSEADKLRTMGELRNRAAHGDFDIALSPSDLRELVRIISILFDLRSAA